MVGWVFDCVVMLCVHHILWAYNIELGGAYDVGKSFVLCIY